MLQIIDKCIFILLVRLLMSDINCLCLWFVYVTCWSYGHDVAEEPSIFCSLNSLFIENSYGISTRIPMKYWYVLRIRVRYLLQLEVLRYYNKFTFYGKCHSILTHHIHCTKNKSNFHVKLLPKCYLYGVLIVVKFKKPNLLTKIS